MDRFNVYCAFARFEINIFFLSFFQMTGLITQGRGDGQQWVTKYQVSYSMDAYTWTTVRDHYGNHKVRYQRFERAISLDVVTLP